MIASIAVEEVLLALKIGFIVLLYLFIWRIVRGASRDLRLPQDSIVLSPAQLRGMAPGYDPSPQVGRLVVVRSPALAQGDGLDLDSRDVTIGRGPRNDLALGADQFASTRHARVRPQVDGVWVEDIGSTNGTFVNGERLEGPRRLAPGDVIRVGETDLRYER